MARPGRLPPEQDREALESLARPLPAAAPPPPPPPPDPPWPFTQVGTVLTQSGDTLADNVGCKVWRLRGPRQTGRGEVYGWEGNAERSVAGQVVGTANLLLEVDGRRFRIVDAIDYKLVPHVELSLDEMRPQG